MKSASATWRSLFLLALGVMGLFALRGLRLPFPGALWPPPAPKIRPPFYAAPGTELSLTRVVGRRQGKRAWEFKAERITRSLDGMTFMAEKISEGQIYEAEKPSCVFRAGQVRYEVLPQRLTIGGGFDGRLSDGTTFTAALVTADLRRKSLTIPGPVKVEGKEVSLTADSLTADLAAETVTLKGNAVIRWSGGTMRAAEVTYSVRDGTFSVQGNQGEGVDLTL